MCKGHWHSPHLPELQEQKSCLLKWRLRQEKHKQRFYIPVYYFSKRKFTRKLNCCHDLLTFTDPNKTSLMNALGARAIFSVNNDFNFSPFITKRCCMASEDLKYVVIWTTLMMILWSSNHLPFSF